jgi:hypothetical protein
MLIVMIQSLLLMLCLSQQANTMTNILVSHQDEFIAFMATVEASFASNPNHQHLCELHRHENDSGTRNAQNVASSSRSASSSRIAQSVANSFGNMRIDTSTPSASTLNSRQTSQRRTSVDRPPVHPSTSSRIANSIAQISQQQQQRHRSSEQQQRGPSNRYDDQNRSAKSKSKFVASSISNASTYAASQSDAITNPQDVTRQHMEFTVWNGLILDMDRNDAKQEALRILQQTSALNLKQSDRDELAYQLFVWFSTKFFSFANMNCQQCNSKSSLQRINSEFSSETYTNALGHQHPRSGQDVFRCFRCNQITRILRLAFSIHEVDLHSLLNVVFD